LVAFTGGVKIEKPRYKNVPIFQATLSPDYPPISNWRRRLCFEVPEGTGSIWTLLFRAHGSGEVMSPLGQDPINGPDEEEGFDLLYYKFDSSIQFVDVLLLEETPGGTIIYNYMMLVNPCFRATDFGNSI